MRGSYFQLLRGSFSLIIMKRNFSKENEERQERWRRNWFDLEARKGRRSPRGLGFLKGACSLQGRCSLFPSLLCLALSARLHPHLPPPPLLMINYDWQALWFRTRLSCLICGIPLPPPLLRPIVSPIWDHAEYLRDRYFHWSPCSMLSTVISRGLSMTCALFASSSEGAALVWQRRKRHFSHCNVVLHGVLCRAVNRYLKLKELLQACPFVVMFSEICQKMDYPCHLPLASAADNKRNITSQLLFRINNRLCLEFS